MDEKTLRRLKALSNENRLAILEYLRRQSETSDADDLGRSVGEIAKQMKVGIPTVSHHLKELYRAGLIRCERQGQHVRCSVNRNAFDELRAFLKDLA
jgi:DNA-binding transcriptional ArsR family regulator